MTLQELSQYDGSIAGKPMYLAIRGTVFDVTTGKQLPPLYSCLCKANGTLGHPGKLQLTVQPVPRMLATVCIWGHTI